MIKKIVRERCGSMSLKFLINSLTGHSKNYNRMNIAAILAIDKLANFVYFLGYNGFGKRKGILFCAKQNQFPAELFVAKLF